MKFSHQDAAALTLGIEMVLSVVLMSALGIWADKKLGTTPWLTVLGFALGAAAGFRALYRFASRPGKDDGKQDKDKPPHGSKEG